MRMILGALLTTTVLALTGAAAQGADGFDVTGKQSDLSKIGGGNSGLVGSSYVDAARLSIHNMNNSGSGADTSNNGSYSQTACCTFAPGGLPQGDAVQAATLFGPVGEELPVAQEPPLYHWRYPLVPVYSFEALRDALTAAH